MLLLLYCQGQGLYHWVLPQSFFGLLFRDRVSLTRSGWTWTHSVGQEDPRHLISLCQSSWDYSCAPLSLIYVLLGSKPGALWILSRHSANWATFTALKHCFLISNCWLWGRNYSLIFFSFWAFFLVILKESKTDGKIPNLNWTQMIFLWLSILVVVRHMTSAMLI